jgi:putative transposase
VILNEFLRKISTEKYAMTVTPSIDLPAWMTEQLSQASPDLVRSMIKTFAEALMSADADAVCGAAFGQREPG